MTILDRIVTDVESALSIRKRLVSMQKLQSYLPSDQSTKDFKAALRTSDISIIAEIKQCSPSKGVLRQPFDPSAVAHSYSLHGADAISVLTEINHFGGSLSHLNTVAHQTNLPVLRKDFIFDPYQIYEAKVFGADAILLIATILDKTQLHELHCLASELNLACLVEVYSENELDHLDFDQVKILGVNNRNLYTFEVDIQHSLNIFNLINHDMIKVSESGLQRPEDLAYLYQHGVDSVLIGESLMRQDDPGLALKELRNKSKSIINANSTR